LRVFLSHQDVYVFGKTAILAITPDHKPNYMKISFLAIVFSIFFLHSSAQQVINIIPKPSNIQAGTGKVQFTKSIKVFADSRSNLDRTYLTQVLTEMGLTPTFVKKESEGDIQFLLQGRTPEVKNEAYQLKIISAKTVKKISATALGRKGLLNALQTLRQLGNKSNTGMVEFPVCSITDEPAFSWRAFLFDESRNFHGKKVVKNLLDEMARLKLNTLHWHLTDDPAWRIEIKKYPRLTSVTSKGNYGHMVKFLETNQTRWDSLFVSPPAQFYTQDDIREIVKYAQARGIIIIPEIEVPGHATAAIYAYPWLGASSKTLGKGGHGDLYDVTDPKVEGFIHDVLDEVISLFPAGIIHIGGDEANYAHWVNSKTIRDFMKANNIPTYSDLQLWSINRMSKYISSKGYRMIGWNEITGDNIRGEAHIEASKSEKLAEGTIVQFWDGEVSLVNKAIEKGYDVVNSNRHFTYLDYPYEVTPLEKVYSFNPIPDGVALKDQKKILGFGCQMWGEFTPTEERLNFQIFPRIAALAEVGWVPAAQKSSFPDFKLRFAKLEQLWKDKGFIKTQLGKY
jgi:hexosaminidase